MTVEGEDFLYFNSIEKVTAVKTSVIGCEIDSNTKVFEGLDDVPPVVTDINVTAGENCGEYTFNAIGSDIEIFFWDFGNGETGTGNPINFSFVENGSFIVFLTVSNNSNEIVKVSVTVHVVCFTQNFTCPCKGENAINIDAGEGTSIWDVGIPTYLLGPNAYFFNNTCLAVYGNLVIDGNRNLTILAGEIKMQPGSSITVGKGSSLNLQNVNDDIDGDGKSGINGCDTMWRGIVLDEGTSNADVGGKIGWMQNSIVQDAQYAITAEPHSKLGFLLGNIFTNNHVGIYSPPHPQGQFSDLSPSYFANNHFSHFEQLLPPFDIDLEYYDESAPFAGIFVNDAVFMIGKKGIEGNPVNFFENIRNGVVSVNGLLGVFQASFSNMSGFLPAFSTSALLLDEIRGVGVYADNCMIAKIGNNKFEYTNTGIYYSNIGFQFQAEQNTMLDVSKGIWGFSDGSPAYSRIVDNIIHFDYYGVITNFSDHFSINNNHLNSNIENADLVSVPPDPVFGIGWAIAIYGSSTNNEFAKEIIGNELNIYAHYNGITFESIDNVDISYNIINSFDSDGIYLTKGIRVKGSDNLSIFYNSVLGESPWFEQRYGFYVEGSQDANLFCNTSSNYDIGFLLGGACNGLNFSRSVIGTHAVGLLVENGTVIGQQQDHKGNTWAGTYSEFAAVNNNVESNDEEIYDDFGFDIELPINSDFWPDSWDTPNSSGALWFKDVDGTSSACNPELNSPPSSNLPANITFADIKTAQGSYSRTYGDMLDWESGRYLYDKLNEKPDLLGLNTEIDAFYQIQEQGTIGILFNIKNQIKDILKMDENEYIEMQNNYSLIIDKWGQIQNMDNLFQYAVTLEDSLNIAEDKLDILGEMLMPLQNMDTKNKAQYQQRLTTIDGISALNQSITSNSILAQNQKLVNEVYLNTVVKRIYALDNSQFAQVTEVSEQCPLLGGDAVYRARVLYQLKEYRNFEAEDLCSEMARASALAKPIGVKSDQTQEIMLFPNPANDKLFIQFNQGLVEHIGEINVFTLDGKLSHSEVLNEMDDISEMDISTLKNGIYYAKVRVNGGTLKTIKLVIIH